MRPTVHALLICDALYREPNTGKLSALGIFQAIKAPDYPVEIPPLSIYAAIGNIRTSTNLIMRLIHLDAMDDSERIIAEERMHIPADGPNSATELGITIPGVVLPMAGDYRLRLEWEGEILAERRLLFRVVGDSQ